MNYWLHLVTILCKPTHFIRFDILWIHSIVSLVLFLKIKNCLVESIWNRMIWLGVNAIFSSCSLKVWLFAKCGLVNFDVFVHRLFIFRFSFLFFFFAPTSDVNYHRLTSIIIVRLKLTEFFYYDLAWTLLLFVRTTRGRCVLILSDYYSPVRRNFSIFVVFLPTHLLQTDTLYGAVSTREKRFRNIIRSRPHVIQSESKTHPVCSWRPNRWQSVASFRRRTPKTDRVPCRTARVGPPRRSSWILIKPFSKSKPYAIVADSAFVVRDGHERVKLVTVTESAVDTSAGDYIDDFPVVGGADHRRIRSVSSDFFSRNDFFPSGSTVVALRTYCVRISVVFQKENVDRRSAERPFDVQCTGRDDGRNLTTRKIKKRKNRFGDQRCKQCS